VDKKLMIYIAFGAAIGFFFGGIWEAIAAMVLIYIALRIDYLIKIFEHRR